MRRRLPPLKALPAFEVAADRLSFSAAAEALNVTHGAISRQVKALEDHLGVALFRRFNRRIALTEAGLALLPSVRQALQHLEAGAAQVAARPRQGPLVVSCLATFMMRWLIPRLYAFSATHPGIEVRLSASHAPVDFAREGVDVAIRVGKAPWPAATSAHPFLEDRVGPVCSPAWLAANRLARASDLKRHTLLHTQTRARAWRDWIEANGVEGVDASAGLRFEHSYFSLEAAAGGLGVAVGSLPLVEADLRSGRLVAPFGFAASGQHYCLLTARQDGDIGKIQAFRQWILGAPGDAPGLRGSS
ncbi:MAG: transcriptional regulator GcvA [Hyphomonadaceae bacterium]|nr:transcriptional regulator GcvA [Hyphomonadaceae bacterium]